MHKRNSLVNQKLPQPLASIIDEGGARLSRMMEQLDNIQISRRAMNCNDFFRALFSLELYIAKDQERHDAERQAKITEGATPAEYKVPRPVLDALLEVYSRIDDPDGLDGISTQFPSLDMNQQILNHRKAGRWAAAQSWYEIKLAEDPRDIDRQLDLLTCLKESGQYGELKPCFSQPLPFPKAISAAHSVDFRYPSQPCCGDAHLRCNPQSNRTTCP